MNNSFQNIMKLRKSGKLSEALEKANQALDNQPDDIWNKRAIAWVYYDFMKKEWQNKNFDNFISWLDKLLELDLPEEEKMVFDTTLILLNKWVYFLLKQKEKDYSKINLLFEKVKKFNISKNEESYFYILKAFHKSYKNHKPDKYIEFIDWWGIENFREEDYLPTEYNDRKIMSIVEQVYIAYSKALLSNAQKYKSKIPGFIKKLDELIKEHPEYKYPPYYKAKFLLLTNEKEKFLDIFIPFVKKNKNVSWVWDVLADGFDDIDKKIACLSKAMLLNNSGQYLVKVRKKLADLFIQKGMYAEAKTEIKKFISTYKKEGWKIPFDVDFFYLTQDWYLNTPEKQDNRDLYYKYQNLADDIIYADIPKKLIVVEYINRKKNIINFIGDNFTHGFFKYNKKTYNPRIGDILQVRLKKIGEEGFYKLLTMNIMPEDTPFDAIKVVEGDLIIHRKGFGFLDDTFVPPQLIKAQNLTHGQFLTAKALLSYNKKKDSWNWKVVKIL